MQKLIVIYNRPRLETDQTNVSDKFLLIIEVEENNSKSVTGAVAVTFVEWVTTEHM